jgi:APA family basic amino acid/polyamine antiporter
MSKSNLRPQEGQADAPSEFPRVLGIFSIIGIVIGAMIGSGIFINPSVVAKSLGSPLLMMAAWVTGGVLSFFGALALAELAAAYTQAGGIYVYLREAYGGLVAFLFGWTVFLVVESGTIAALAVGFSTKYLPYFVDITDLQSKIVSVALILTLAAINYCGVKKGAFLTNFLTSIKFLALIGVCAVIFIFAVGDAGNFVRPEHFASESGGLFGNFGVALVAVLWAYKGWETGTYCAGEIENPQRKLPLGIFIGTVSVIFLYILANLAYLYVFPAPTMAQSNRIAADTVEAAIGPIGASIVAMIILTSITGTCNGHIMTSPRVLYAMAKDGHFFSRLARIHPKYKTPHVAIAAVAFWGCVLCLSGTFEQLFTYVIFGCWIFMGLTVGGVMILRKKRPDIARPYKTWGYPWTPILFVVSAVLLVANSVIMSFWNSIIGLLIIASGVPVYVLWKRGKTALAAGR